MRETSLSKTSSLETSSWDSSEETSKSLSIKLFILFFYTIYLHCSKVLVGNNFDPSWQKNLLISLTKKHNVYLPLAFYYHGNLSLRFYFSF